MNERNWGQVAYLPSSGGACRGQAGRLAYQTVGQRGVEACVSPRLGRAQPRLEMREEWRRVLECLALAEDRSCHKAPRAHFRSVASATPELFRTLAAQSAAPERSRSVTTLRHAAEPRDLPGTNLDKSLITAWAPGERLSTAIDYLSLFLLGSAQAATSSTFGGPGSCGGAWPWPRRRLISNAIPS
jgi:hypothetical protein